MASARKWPLACKMAPHMPAATKSGTAIPARPNSKICRSSGWKVHSPIGTNSIATAKSPNQLRRTPSQRTAAILAACSSGVADATVRTPAVAKPHPAAIAKSPLKETKMPARPTPSGPTIKAIALVRKKAATKTKIEAPPMSALERRMRAKAIRRLLEDRLHARDDAVAVFDGHS